MPEPTRDTRPPLAALAAADLPAALKLFLLSMLPIAAAAVGLEDGPLALGHGAGFVLAIMIAATLLLGGAVGIP